jgi:hypothetical protein
MKKMLISVLLLSSCGNVFDKEDNFEFVTFEDETALKYQYIHSIGGVINKETGELFLLYRNLSDSLPLLYKLDIDKKTFEKVMLDKNTTFP